MFDVYVIEVCIAKEKSLVWVHQKHTKGLFFALFYIQGGQTNRKKQSSNQ